MSMIEVTTDYGLAKFDSKTLAEGLKRAELDTKDNPTRRTTDTLSPQKTVKA